MEISSFSAGLSVGHQGRRCGCGVLVCLLDTKGGGVVVECVVIS